MTTIAIDNIRKIIVTDSMFSDPEGGMKWLNGDPKAWKVPEGWICGCGSFADIARIVAWFQDGKPGDQHPPITDQSGFFLLTADGAFEASGPILQFTPIRQRMAEGSGGLAAEALMAYGETAEEAVLAATRVDLYSGGAVMVYPFGGEAYEYTAEMQAEHKAERVLKHMQEIAEAKKPTRKAPVKRKPAGNRK